MDLVERFEHYHNENPEVYEYFKKFTFKAIERGKKKLSAWLIVNQIRWEVIVEIGTVEEFKIPNDFIALYSRLFMADFPKYDGFFETRPMKRL